jgi:5'(3')-deoxyribonucleotidase
MNLDELLEDLYSICVQPVYLRKDLINKLENVLTWLVQNDTDENCRKVDSFIVTRLDNLDQKKIPEDVYEILFDMGSALHDTHASPEVAKNFSSTPEQLLERTHALSG